ncbi:ABC transporter ATP-binding protein [Mesobacillus foraminis]|uniref:ATP-binding cassette domain-containing protein n=1 Tax=Mesobacillus foraminis TaxID=279826 RepID=UPI0039A06B34
MKVIDSHNLTKNFLRTQVLDHLTFSIEENKITGLIGRNGAGKTTLLKLIAGLIRPSAGDIQVFSENPFNNLNISLNSVFIDDQMSFPPALQLSDILKEAARFYPNWNDPLAKRLFDYFSLDSKGYHHRLSKGKISTFNSILGIASRCPLTIFDEPTTGMDEGVRKDFYRALLKDYISHPRTILISSHHLDEIEELLEDILFLHEGKKLLQVPASSLKEYAIGIKGPKETIQKVTAGNETLFKKTSGMNTIYAVVKNSSGTLAQEAQSAGLEVLPVRSSDLFVYLTSKTKGGIDDVFTES